MSLDNLAERIAGFGVPVLVLLVATFAAPTTTLSPLDGQLGIAAIAMLGLLGRISVALVR